MNMTLAVILTLVCIVVYTISDRKKVKKDDTLEQCRERLDALEKQLNHLLDSLPVEMRENSTTGDDENPVRGQACNP